MSLGSDFGPGNLGEPDVIASNNASAVGITVVASAGNAGDSSYIVGSPSAADAVISVAASEDGSSRVDGFLVNAPVSIEGVMPGAESVRYDWNSPDLPITGQLVYPAPGSDPTKNQRTGCYPFDAANQALIDGKVVLLDWTEPSCGGSIGRTGNAVDAGAIGVLIADNDDVFDLYISGSDVVPAYSIPRPIGDVLSNTLASEVVTVTLTNAYQGAVVYDEPSSVDIISSFSSRGPRGTDSMLKPEITAPGGSIFAAAMGTGDKGTSKNGTSMAAPHITGVAALMVDAHPDYTPEEIKAAIMNTAVDLADGAPIPLSGAGRVDAYRAVDTGVVAIGDEDLVSLSYGVLYDNTPGVVATKQVSVENKSVTTQVYNTDWMFQTGSMTQTAGADLMVEPAQVTIPAGDTGVVTVTLAFTPSEMMSDFGGLEEYYGFVTLTPDGGTITDALRVPFYFLPRPYAKLAIDADTTIVNPLTDAATLTMTHSGPISSSTWIYPALTWNATPDPTMDSNADVRGFGLDYGWPVSAYGDIIAVAIDTWGPWHDPQPYFAEFDLNLDVDQDGTDDYLDFNFNYGWALGGDSTNDWVVIQVDLATGMLYLASPYGIYTDFNASFMEWYLPAAWQDLGTSNSDFGYQLVSWDYFANEQAGTPGQFNYRHPPFAWITSGDPGPAMPYASGLVGIYDLPGYLYSQPKGVMLVDYAGDPRNVDGAQAYFVPLALGAAYLEAGHLAPFAMDPGTAVTVTVGGLPVLG